MGRKKGTETRTERVFRLIGLLRASRRALGLDELADRLDCSKQTVLAMLDDVRRSGLLEISEEQRGRRKAFRAIGQGIDAPVRLRAEDLQNLSLCRALVEPYLPEGVLQDVDDAFPQLERLLRTEREETLARALLGRVSALGTAPPSDRIAFLQHLIEALVDRRVCRVTYRSPNRGEPATYQIAPREILLYRDALYAVCSYVPEGGEPRDDYDDMTLAVHRIEDLDLLEQTFSDRPPRRPARRAFGFMPGKPFRVRARFTGWAAVHVRERAWSEDQRVEPDGDGAIVLDMTAQSRPEVVTWLLGFGSHAELLEPEDLRREVQRELRLALARYEEGREAPP